MPGRRRRRYVVTRVAAIKVAVTTGLAMAAGVTGGRVPLLAFPVLVAVPPRQLRPLLAA
jgi:hypothetical protein